MPNGHLSKLHRIFGQGPPPALFVATYQYLLPFSQTCSISLLYQSSHDLKQLFTNTCLLCEKLFMLYLPPLFFFFYFLQIELKAVWTEAEV